MSLDVYLTMPGTRTEPREAIYIRKDGQMREVTRAEWDEMNPGREPVTVQIGGESGEVYEANITHNLGAMAEAAGVYKHLWRPDELGITKASDLIGPLADGLGTLKADPERFKKFNPPNEWGTYGGLLVFVEKYLEACKKYPEADVQVSR